MAVSPPRPIAFKAERAPDRTLGLSLRMQARTRMA
jgi:hypothetical protein